MPILNGDISFLNAIAHVLLKDHDDVIDWEFIKAHASGWQDYVDGVLADYSPEQVQDRMGGPNHDVSALEFVEPCPRSSAGSPACSPNSVHVPILNGDISFLNAIAHVLLKDHDDVIDWEFIKAHASGWQDYVDGVLADYSPEQVQDRMCGPNHDVSPALIRRIAHVRRHPHRASTT